MCIVKLTEEIVCKKLLLRCGANKAGYFDSQFAILIKKEGIKIGIKTSTNIVGSYNSYSYFCIMVLLPKTSR